MVKTFHQTFGRGSLKLMDDYITAHGGPNQGVQAFLAKYEAVLQDDPSMLAAHLRQWRDRQRQY
jgi:hypothetical protein